MSEPIVTYKIKIQYFENTRQTFECKSFEIVNPFLCMELEDNWLYVRTSRIEEFTSTILIGGKPQGK